MAVTPSRTVKIGPEWDACAERARKRGVKMTEAVRQAIEVWPKNSYRAEVYRDGKWWMIYVPEIDAITQARDESKVWRQARDLIAVSLDLDSDAVSVELIMLPSAKEEGDPIVAKIVKQRYDDPETDRIVGEVTP